MKNCTLLFLILSILYFGCSKENLKPVIDSDLQTYYDSFLKEAQSRNITINIPKNMVIQFGLVDSVAGRTYYAENKIVIDSIVWKKATVLDKEFLLFHEFGHLLLNRPHNLQTLPNGEYKSMMQSYENIPIIENTLLYLGVRRKYYIDELFDINTPTPDWSKSQYDPFPITNSTRKLLASQDFDESKELSTYLDQSPNAQFKIQEKGILSVKLPKGDGFSLVPDKVMEMASVLPAKRSDFIKSNNYEIEFRYRLKSGTFNYSYSPNTYQNQAVFSHTFNPISCKVFSFKFRFRFSIYTINNDFNTVRLVRKGNFWSVYLNGKHLFYTDVWSAEQANQLIFAITGNEENAEFDLDYFRLYEL